ncbi:MAG: PVC-type heme-binding CxxCH protein, partial [Pirellulales bacterium]
MLHRPIHLLSMVLVVLAAVASPVQAAEPNAPPTTSNHDPQHAVADLDVHAGLALTLFASEPVITSVTNLDIDYRGRVWVCEVLNYRKHQGTRPEGDRILILEDRDGDGKADDVTVFYQGHDVDAAMGICVLGNRVIVTCSPNVLVLTDTDGDDRADHKEVLFAKTGPAQDDHGAHSFLFGPDGRFYWDFGNATKQVHDATGQPVADWLGRPVADGGRPFRGGMAVRCQMDGRGLEVLGHNFRNCYEVTVDSFGTVWQSDNDDDGHRGVRINYVMEGGNFGYRDERTGGAWREPRTGMHPDVPHRHWHVNDPGVVPNLLLTGGGSPAGIAVYEGRLLPRACWDQLVHCDPGPRVVR